jgi:hypothetical protein
MLTGTPLPTLLLLSALSAACQAQRAQKTAPRPPYVPPPEVDVSSEVREIHVDQFCRILPDQAQSAGAGAKLRPRKDSVICHLETVLQSSHAEERLVGNELERSVVHIEEQEYLLQNVTGYPVVFVVEQPLRKGWFVDSDPPPQEVAGSTAIFRVDAVPGEIVRLHVGVRHEIPKKPKPAGSLASAVGGSHVQPAP